ncbi:MAG: energy transducer TonB [Gammaproteobacteria bacterium]|nr:energy transducer TonB [Gammaproteobacteria bacterium]
MQWRLALTIPIGLALIFVMFFGLWRMISGPVNAANTVTATQINFTMLNRDTQVRTKQRVKPKRLPPPKEPHVKVQVATHHNPQRTHVPNLTPQLGPGMSGNSVSIGGLISGTIKSTTPIPLVRIPPQYPRRALLASKSGFVVVAFTITKSGSVTDLRVVDSEPRGFFEQAALRAVSQWRYRPAPIERNVQTTIEFKLNGGK